LVEEGVRNVDNFEMRNNGHLSENVRALLQNLERIFLNIYWKGKLYNDDVERISADRKLSAAFALLLSLELKFVINFKKTTENASI
jgi:hypothetical protein